MRAVQLADIEVATRALLHCPAATRPALIATLIAQAKTADSYRKRMGKLHPRWGSGTLMSAAARYPQTPRIDRMTPDALGAMALIIKTLQYQQP